MGIIKTKCPECGADIQIDKTKTEEKCSVCGALFSVEKVVCEGGDDECCNDVDKLFALAKACEEEYDEDEAKEYYRKILEIDPNNDAARIKLGKIFYICDVAVDKSQLNAIEKYINSGEKLLAVKTVQDISGLDMATAKNYVESYSRIDKKKPQPPEELKAMASSGGCYVATCVYGSYDCPQVWTLRRYRDSVLASTWYGRAFIRTYYAVSPTCVKWFGNTKWFKAIFQKRLDRMVEKLKAQGVESTPYIDRDWN